MFPPGIPAYGDFPPTLIVKVTDILFDVGEPVVTALVTLIVSPANVEGNVGYVTCVAKIVGDADTIAGLPSIHLEGIPHPDCPSISQQLSPEPVGLGSRQRVPPQHSIVVSGGQVQVLFVLENSGGGAVSIGVPFVGDFGGHDLG
jgi:hypothetical protein